MGLELTMDALKALMLEVLKSAAPDFIKGQLTELSTKMQELERKQIFSHTEGDFLSGETKTKEGSVLNPYGFLKVMKQVDSMQAKGITVNDSQLCNMVASGGGIFTKLSPAMEEFGKLVKARLNPTKLLANGFDSNKYKDMCIAQVKQTGMNEGVGQDGGFTVPVEYSATVIEFAILMSSILSKVWRVPMRSNSAKWPRLAQDDDSFFGGFHFHWIDEGETKPKHKVKFEQVTFTAHKCAGICVLTDELIEDSIINIVNYITALGTRAWMYELEHMVIDGSGVGQPLGFSNDPIVIANAVARTAAGTLRYQDLVNLESAMGENFRNLEWIFRRAALGTIRGLMDTANAPVWKETWGSLNNTPTLTPTVISYPYHVTRNAPKVGQRADLSLVDLSYYMLAMRKDMTIDISSFPYWEEDETGIRFVARVDGKCGTPYAFKILAGTGS